MRELWFTSVALVAAVVVLLHQHRSSSLIVSTIDSAALSPSRKFGPPPPPARTPHLTPPFSPGVDTDGAKVTEPSTTPMSTANIADALQQIRTEGSPAGDESPLVQPQMSSHAADVSPRAARTETSCDILRRTLKFAPECGDGRVFVYPLLITGTGRTGTLFVSDEFRRGGYDVSHDNMRVGTIGAVAWPLAIRETEPFDQEVYNTSGYTLPNFARIAMGFKFLTDQPKARFRVVAHQTREPLACIASRADRVGNMYAPISYSNPHLFRDVLRYAPSFPPQEEVERWYRDRDNKGNWPVQKRLRVALFHFVFWHDFVDAYADFTFRVEDFDLGRIAALAGLPRPTQRSAGQDSSRSKRPAPRSNHHDAALVPRNLTWAALEAVSPFVAASARALAIKYGYETGYRAGT